MSDDKHILHFSLGPVQGFIGTARRTRDLWAGSFLLSWLSAVAMVEVRKKGEILFPSTDDDPLVGRLENRSKEEPRIGTVPNRFKADVPKDFLPQDCELAVRAAWQRLANAVWTEFLGNHPTRRHETREIWDRQVWNFWEISWVKGERDRNDGAWLEQRKTWRIDDRLEEGGDHCTLMGDWQEISGYVRARERAAQDTFWSNLRDCKFWDNDEDKNDDKKKQQNGKKLLLDIVEGERLCAIALIKRLFPRLTKQGRERVFGWDPCGKGGGNWPSTGHIAAAHWIKRAHEVEKGACCTYARHVRATFDPIHFAEQATPISCLKVLRDAVDRLDRDWVGLDANFFDPNDLNNRRAMPLLDKKTRQPIEQPSAKEHAQLRHVLIGEYKALIAKLCKAEPDLGEPAGYFALLRMDGDDVGKLLDTLGADKVSPALARFSNDVPDLVNNNNGVLVYAGGDDVLALFPIEDALAAARELRGAYLKAWNQDQKAWNQDQPPTISAGLVFADHHEPFRAVVEESRRLLEDVAKDGNGRDSIACSVLKPSGRAVEWVSAWTAPDCSFITEKVAAIAERMRSEPPFSNRFIYNLRTRYLDPIEDRFEELGLTADELDRVLAAERAGSRELPRDADRDRERELVRTLRELTQPHPGKDGVRLVDTPVSLQPDGLVLARFLAQKGLKVEEEGA